MADTLPSELGVEHSILNWLDDLDWESHGGDSSEWGTTILDQHYDRSPNQIIYWNILREQVIALNDDITKSNVDAFLNSLRRDLDHDNLMEGNREFHQLLCRGKKFKAKHNNGTTKPTYIDLIDFEQPENNRFIAVNQFRVSRTHSIRPDIMLFINGIPLVTMELKSLAQNNDFNDAISDLHDYEDDAPRLFIPGLFNVAADTTELRYGAVGASTEFYEPWNDAPTEYQDDNEMKQAVQALCNPGTIIDILDNFVFYERKTDGLAKIIPRYMQYYAVLRILDRVADGTHTNGLIWHTQGSGKSYTMLYAAKNLLEQDILDTPQIFIIVDTAKLSSQMGDTLSNIEFAQSEVADSIQHLQQLIEDGASQLVLTTIQKFENVDPDTAGNDEVVVMSDEAHRFMEEDLGSRLDAALPDAYHFGFTGTPVREGEKEHHHNTFREFSPPDEEYLHRYSVRDGIEDGLILPVYFTLWHNVEWNINEAGLDDTFEDSFRELPPEEKLEIIMESVTSTELAELRPRVKAYVDKIDTHFDGVDENGWKGMVVTPSREAAALYGELLIDRRDAEEVKVLYTSTGDDSKLVQQFHTTPDERDEIIRDFRKDEHPKLLVVHDMLLTGFDAPILKTIYLDRNLQNHNLMQAIARTNRVADGKNNGEIVDLQGVFQNIDEALDYDIETKTYAARDRDELFEELETTLDALEELFEGIPKTDSQESLNTCLARVSKYPEKREFKRRYDELQDLYESLAPDGELIRSGAQDRYKWLTRVYIAFQRDINREENPENDAREKTKHIIEENVDIAAIQDQYPVYKLSEEHLEAVKQLDDPAAKATKIIHTTKDHLQPRANQNPRYKRLSERVTEMVNNWNTGGMDDPEAVEVLERLERETIAVKTEAEERGMSNAEFAVFTALMDEQTDHIEDETEAETLAQDIVAAFKQEIDTTFEGWRTNDDTLRDIEITIIDVLVKEHGYPELVKADSFVDNVRDYLTENYGNAG